MSKSPKNADSAFSNPDLTKLAHEALDSFSRSRRGNATGSSTAYSHWHYLREDVIPLWAPEEFLIWQAKENGESAETVQPILDKILGAKSREISTTATAFHKMTFGDPKDFGHALKKYLESASGPVSSQGSYYASHATHPIKSTAKKAFLIWEDRRDELGDEFDLGEFLLPLLKKSRQSLRNESTLVAASLCVVAGREQRMADGRKISPDTDRKRGWEIANCGNRFKKEPQTRTPAPGGGYYSHGGDFADPAHKQFAAFPWSLWLGAGTGFSYHGIR